MAITTLARYKLLTGMGVAATPQDTWIEALIPEVERDYVHIRNRPFDVGTRVTFATTGLSSGEDMTISVNQWDYTVPLRANDTANMIAHRTKQYIEPSNVFRVNVMSSGSTGSAPVVFFERFPVFQERFSVLDLVVSPSTVSGAITATVAKMQTIYPTGSELTAVRMIKYQMEQGLKSVGITSETLGDYSYTIGNGVDIDQYPREITKSITRYAVTL